MSAAVSPALERVRFAADRAGDYLDRDDTDTALDSFMNDVLCSDPDLNMFQFPIRGLLEAISAGTRQALTEAMDRYGLAPGTGWYTLIAADGTLTHHNQWPTSDVLAAHLGQGWQRVDLFPGYGMAALVTVDGGGQPRNPIGAVLLLGLGAPAIVYAGPILLVGWDHDDTAQNPTRPVTSMSRAWLTRLRRDVVSALDGKAPPARTPAWVQTARAYAAAVTAAPHGGAGS